MEPIYELQASVLRMLANPRRLEMIHVLADGPMEVGRIAQRLGISQPNASQHLALLRQTGLVEIERNGREVRYQLTDPQVIAACSIMRGFLQRRIDRLSTVTVAADERVPAGVEA
ncbi:MAG TPA: metalloregulator ArsR/SmtB family transcription factor [Candidatus Limnocylindrales bacterium]